MQLFPFFLTVCVNARLKLQNYSTRLACNAHMTLLIDRSAGSTRDGRIEGSLSYSEQVIYIQTHAMCYIFALKVFSCNSFPSNRIRLDLIALIQKTCF